MLPATVAAAVTYVVEDEFDDPRVARRLSGLSVPEDLRKFARNAKAEVDRLEESELVKYFGRSVPRPKLSYALPLAQNRGGGFGGAGYVREEIKFFVIGDRGAVERRTALYSDGSSDSHSFLFFKVDKNFPRLDSLDKAPARFAWERANWPVLLEFIREKKEKEKKRLQEPYFESR